MERDCIGGAADMAGNHGNRPELAHRPRVAQNHAVQQTPFDIRQSHAPERLPAPGAQSSRRFLFFTSLRLHQRDQLAGDKRKGNEDSREHDSRHGENDLDVVFGKPRPEPALKTEQQHKNKSRDDRRDREGQIDQCDQKTLSGELKFRDGPGRGDAENQIERYRDAAAVNVNRIAAAASGSRIELQIDFDAFLESFAEHNDQRQEQEKPQEQKRHGDQDGANPARLAHARGPAPGIVHCSRY